METFGRKRRKATRHRKRHIPVGPAGVWFQSQKQQKRLDHHPPQFNRKDAGESEEEEEEDMEENQRENHLSKSKSSATTPCFGSHPAWMLMQCTLGFCTPALSASLSLWDRYQLLRPHVPQQYVMLPEIMYESSNNNNNNHPSTIERKCRFMKLPSNEKLLVLLQTIQSHNSSDHSGWTLILQDETGCTIQAWIQPALVREEWEQPTGPQFLRVGNVLLLQDISFMLQSVSSQNGSGGQFAAMDDLYQNNQTSKKLMQQRMLLVSKANIAQVWTTKEAEKSEHDQKYLEWTEKRNSFPSSLALQQDDDPSNNTTASLQQSTTTSSQQTNDTDHDTNEQGLTPATLDTQDFTTNQPFGRRSTQRHQPSQEAPQVGEPFIRSLHANRMCSATNNAPGANKELSQSSQSDRRGNEPMTSNLTTNLLGSQQPTRRMTKDQPIRGNSCINNAPTEWVTPASRNAVQSDPSKNESTDALVSTQHETPQLLRSTPRMPMPRESSIFHSTDRQEEPSTKSPSSTPAVSMDWFSSSTSNAPGGNKELSQSSQSERRGNEPMTTNLTTNLLGSQQPTRRMTKDQPTRHKLSSVNNAATGLVTPATRNPSQSDPSKNESEDPSVSTQHEPPQLLRSTPRMPMPRESSILHSTDRHEESSTKSPPSTPAVSMDWFSSSTSNARGANKELSQSSQSDRQGNEPMTSNVTTNLLGSQQPTRTMTKDQPIRGNSSANNAATGLVTPAPRISGARSSSWQQQHSQQHSTAASRNPYQRKNLPLPQEQQDIAMTPLATPNKTPMTHQERQSANKSQERQNGLARVVCQDVTQVVENHVNNKMNPTKPSRSNDGPVVVSSKNALASLPSRKKLAQKGKSYSTPVSTLWSTTTPSMMNLNLPSSDEDDEEDHLLGSSAQNKTSIMGQEKNTSFARTARVEQQHDAHNKQSASASLLFQASSFAAHNYLPSSSDEDD